MEKDTERALKLFIVLSRASKVISEESQKLIDESGLNSTEFGVLELLFHRGQQPIQQIGKKILMGSGSMTYVVDKLERKKLLARVSCEKDKRVTYIAITESGKGLIQSIFPKHAKNIEKLMSELDSKEQEDAIELLRKLGLSVRNLS